MVLSPVSVVALVLGIALLGTGALAWSGAWRGWASPEPTRAAPITLVPGVGLFLLALGAAPLIGGLLVLLAFLAAVGSWLILLSEPPWWGPRWWRERGTAGSSEVEDLLRAGRVPPERDSEYLVLSERAPEAPRWRRTVVLLDPELGAPTLVHDDGACHGSLLAFDDDLVFAADRRDDATRPGPTIRVMPAAGLAVRQGSSPRDARVPVVVVTAGEGTRWSFEVARAGSVVSVLRRLYRS